MTCSCYTNYQRPATIYVEMLQSHLWYSVFCLFQGLGILDLVADLRNIDDEKVIIQCEVFDDEKQSDDDEIVKLTPGCVDINNHREVFNAVFHKVCIIGVAISEISMWDIDIKNQKIWFWYQKQRKGFQRCV